MVVVAEVAGSLVRVVDAAAAGCPEAAFATAVASVIVCSSALVGSSFPSECVCEGARCSVAYVIRRGGVSKRCGLATRGYLIH